MRLVNALSRLLEENISEFSDAFLEQFQNLSHL